MTDSPNIGLPLMEAAQAQKHVTHNEALILLDAILQVAVSNMSASSPPSAPSAGMRVIVGPSASGVFAGQSGKIAYFEQSVWRFFQPKTGWIVWSTPDAALFIYTGAAWTIITELFGSIQNLGMLGVGASASAANPLSVRAGNALFTSRYAADGGDGSLRFKLNKENTSASVSQLYQTDWSGRAETGLTGNDLWSVRRSNDGVTWTTPLAVDIAQVTIGGALNVAIGAQTSSQPSIDATHEWNNASVTFGGWRLNVTDTASAAASMLSEWQVDGVRRAGIRKDGTFLLGASGGGLADGGGGTVNIVNSSGAVVAFGNTNVSLLSRSLSFGASLGSQDLLLSRKAAATLQLGAADSAAPVAQTICAQSVVTGTTNASGANLIISGSQGTGTGAGGSVSIRVAPAGTSGAAQNALADGLVVNANRSVFIPTNVTVGDNGGVQGRLTIGVGLTAALYFGNRGSIGSFTDGIVVMRNNATTGFDRLCFGGTAATFPAIKRSGSVLQARLADDSAFAGMECSFLRPASFTVATVPSASALGAGATIYVSNEIGGAVPAFSDGAAWRRVTDRAIIS